MLQRRFAKASAVFSSLNFVFVLKTYLNAIEITKDLGLIRNGHPQGMICYNINDVL